ncbi:MAG: amino acid permease [Phycisphaerae bacterium]|jgi:APA family basic amino acid/polyamine antiporter|nr:amino acid permease [Phycisphaerae bacterium]
MAECYPPTLVACAGYGDRMTEIDPIERQAVRQQQMDLPRRIGFWGAIAVMIGVVIGSGIFRTPTTVAQNLGDPWLILAFWLLAGGIALCGALTFAELATMMPRSGGIYVFLKEGYGSPTAFVFGWTYMLITKPSAAGGIAIIFAEHFNSLTGLDWNTQALTCGALFALTMINVLGVRGSARFAIVLTTLKFAALLVIIVLGVVTAIGGVRPEGGFAPTDPPVSLLAAIVPVMAAIMWTYDGWSDVGAIAGEVKNPERSLPRIYIIGTLAVIGLYVLANAVYLWHISLADMRATSTVAPLLLDRLVGPVGAAAVTLIIIVSTLGSSHASVMTGARVTFAQARDGLLFGFLGRIHPRFETPAVSLWVQFSLSCLAVVVLGDFASLADSFVFTMWIFYGLAALAVILLRVRRPHQPRPFRVPGYPIVPGLFVAASAVMTVLSVASDPATTLMWIGVLAAGYPVYLVWRRLVPREIRD